MKYVISNEIQFVNGAGVLHNSPSTATHYKYEEARRFLTMHPDHSIVIHGNCRNSKKKRIYVISTSQKYIGKMGEIVTDISNAMTFEIPEDAFDYIDSNPTIKNYIGEPQVIDFKFHKQKRMEEISVQKNSAENTKRIIFPPHIRRAVFAKSSTCAICGKPIDEGTFNIDHIVPLSKGGTNDLDNLRPVHEECNKLKGCFTDEELLSKVGDIGCYQLYNSPQSAISAMYFRAFVRGIIHQHSNNAG